jgi:D-ornithine 4,5-aminomutase subunit alpha
LINEKFEQRKAQLEKMSDEELNLLFWQKAEEIVNPLTELAKKNTSPSIERSVLLRMGFNSLQAKAIVEGIFERDLLGKGAGSILLNMAKKTGKDYLTYGKELISGKNWEELEREYRGV